LIAFATLTKEHSYVFVQELLSRIPRRHITILNSTLGLFTGFLAGQCNVLATEGSELSLSILKALGYRGNLTVSKREYTTEMFALASLDSDQEWADFLNAITMALLYAEEVGITKETAERIGETRLFGDEYKTMFVDAIKTLGNFGELYSFPMPRTSRNLPNDGTTGLLASPSLGDVGIENNGYNDLGPTAGGTLETVLERRSLHCGVRGGRPGFANYDSDQSTWSGMDVDFCTALAANLFDGEKRNVRFFDAHSSTNSNGFLLLQKGSIDMFAGSLWTLESDMRENVTQTGFAFSQPYFYAPANDSR
jgi:Bacterial extracellular solute-binding proteins, family 3